MHRIADTSQVKKPRTYDSKYNTAESLRPHVIQGINVMVLSSEIMQDLLSDTKCCTENQPGPQENVFFQILKIHHGDGKNQHSTGIEKRTQYRDIMVILPATMYFPYFRHV